MFRVFRNKSIYLFIGFFIYNITVSKSANSQCTINSVACGGYTVQTTITAVSIVPLIPPPPYPPAPCPFGYNYNVTFNYSITVSGSNTCFNGSIGIQPQILCNGGQNNGYFTIFVPAPTVGSPSSTITYTGTLTTTTGPYNSAPDCLTATPSSLNCNSLQITIFGPGISSATYSCSLIVLPIKLREFYASCKNNNAYLSWTTSAESENNYFEIEHSTDASNWQTVGRVDGADNTTIDKKYSFTHQNIAKDRNFYRLKQVDINNQSKYSTIVSVKSCEDNNSAIFIYPNPSDGKILLQVQGDIKQISKISVTQLQGKEIYTSNKYQPEINLTAYPSGIYFISIQMGDKIHRKKIVLTH